MQEFTYRGIKYSVAHDIEKGYKARTKIQGVDISFKSRVTLAGAQSKVEDFIDNHLDGNIKFR